jgi:hypothetical protein
VRLHRFVSLVLSTALLTGCVPPEAGSPPATDPAQSQKDLDALTVAKWESMRGYSRDRFPHWIEQPDGCSTREEVLKRDGSGVQTGAGCRVTAGSWTSRYDNVQYSDAGKLDIDHMVPLANAWRTGANKWTDDQRKQFANDLTRPQLAAVSLSVNRSKGDQDPSQWKPSDRGYWCVYAENWITVKSYWRLTVTEDEKTALVEMLGTCQWPSNAPAT